MRNNALSAICVLALGASLSAIITYPSRLPPYKATTAAKAQNKGPARAIQADGAARIQELSPLPLAETFHHRSAAKSPSAPTIEPERPKEIEPVEAKWLKLLGEITDEAGVVRLYFKDSRSGVMHRFRTDGAEEDAHALIESTPDSFVLSINGERCRVPRSKR